MCESTSYDRSELVRSGGRLWAPPTRSGGNLRPVVSDGEGGFRAVRATRANTGRPQGRRPTNESGRSRRNTARGAGASTRR